MRRWEPWYVDRIKRKQRLSGSWIADRAKSKQYWSGSSLIVANFQFRVIFGHILKSYGKGLILTIEIKIRNQKFKLKSEMENRNWKLKMKCVFLIEEALWNMENNEESMCKVRLCML